MRLAAPTLVVIAAFGFACSGSPTGDLAVQLTDAPGPYDHVYVTITEVSAHISDGGGGDKAAPGAPGPGSTSGTEGPGQDGGWVSINVPAVTIDLLTLQNGVKLPLGDAQVPAGNYDNLRLVVSSASVVVGGVTSSLTIPSGSERGIQVKYAFAVGSGDHAVLVLDFQADASIHQTGTGSYTMVPVLDVASESHG